jgi:antitoxin (DNA-binding transcriptional repressor) of toxin-antitoxin stability system
MSHMNSVTVTIRDLRNRFPRVRKLVETAGEVLLSERGKTKYRLVLHTPPRAGPPPVDYWARLTSYHPRPVTAPEERSLQEDNRGER